MNQNETAKLCGLAVNPALFGGYRGIKKEIRCYHNFKILFALPRFQTALSCAIAVYGLTPR